jgi:alkylation response protein AidB-like acyl-CoA dehydrogenase
MNMEYLGRERSVLHSYLPGFDEFLVSRSLAEFERPGNPAIRAFRECGGAGLLVPRAYGGGGADALAALRIQRSLGSRSPSLAVAVTMHHFTVASLVAVSEVAPGFEWMVLQAVVENRLLLASGFAEGQPDSGILRPSMIAVPTTAGFRLSGVKRPCSLARSMSLLTASVLVPREDGRGEQLAVALIPADSEGLSVSPFWGSFALAGAESEQITLDNVLVPHDLLVRIEVPADQHVDDVQTAGFLWFELLITGSYLGVASALVERVLGNDRVPNIERVRLYVELEGAMQAAENIARRMRETQTDQSLLVDALLARYAAQDAIARAVPRAVELLGGLTFITADDVGYFAAAVNGLGFHPPSRSKMAGPLTRYLGGKPIEIV